MSLCGDGDARWAEGSATIDTAPQAPRRWDGVVQAVENRSRPS
jgi:hypothetical protein